MCHHSIRLFQGCLQGTQEKSTKQRERDQETSMISSTPVFYKCLVCGKAGHSSKEEINECLEKLKYMAGRMN